MNAKISINRQKISPSLFVEGAVCLFGKRYLRSPGPVFNEVNHDEKLSEQLACSIAELPHQFLNFNQELITIPQSLSNLLSHYQLGLSDAFICLLVEEVENNYWLNLAIQELQGVHETAYPKLHFVCDLLNSLFDEKWLPADLSCHPFAQLGLIKIQTNGPLAFSSLKINQSYWQYLINPRLAFRQVSVLAIDDKELEKKEAKKIDLISFAEVDVFQNVQVQKLPVHLVVRSGDQEMFIRDISLNIRLQKVSCLHLYANYFSGLSFGFAIGEMLNRQVVVPKIQTADSIAELLFLAQAYQWLVMLDAEQLGEWVYEGDYPLVVLHKEKYRVDNAVSQQDGHRVYQLEQKSFDERVATWNQWVDLDIAKTLASKWLVDTSKIQFLMNVSGLSAEDLSNSAEKTIYKARIKSSPESLQGLAFHLPYSIEPEAVVFNSKIENDLQKLVNRCLHRETIFSGLGNSLAANQKTGVKALFSGESGTGKTLAASYIASQLGIPVFRMDLGAILNKYVGETEKNIHKLMEQAAADDFILLIDEADALFGKRSDAESGGERFANMLTNYLLSRIEQHQGIVLMTTNGLGRIDSAFMRRMDMIVEFQSPELEERARIWQSHLGDRSPGEQYCRQLASFCDLTGGYIRNAVLTAASEIPFSDQTILPYGILLKTIAQEYRKSGKPLPPKLTNQLALHAV